MSAVNELLSPPRGAIHKPISSQEAAELLPGFEKVMDPYFPKKGATCGVEHMKYVLQVMYPLQRELKRVIVTRTGMCTYATLATFMVGDRDLDHLGPGHIRFMGDPGTGKSLIGSTMQRTIGANSKRVQGTDDLQPSDITGNDIIQVDDTGKRIYQFVPGPVFSDTLLFDEQSRASGRSQAALLQSMSEGTVTINGVTRPANPQVISTDNTSDSEGVKPLPSAMLDRIPFMIPAENFTAAEYTEIIRRARSFHKIELNKICDYTKVKEIQKYFHENIFVHAEIDEFLGKFAEAIKDIDRIGYMGDLRTRLKFSDHDYFIKPGSTPLSGRGSTHLDGAMRVLAAYRYRNFATLADVRKVLKHVVRGRMRYSSNALSVSSRELVHQELWNNYGGFGKTEMAEFLLDEITRGAWQYASEMKG